MNLLLSPKDTSNKILLEAVAYAYQEGSTLAVVFKDGRSRSYPMLHLWYWEQKPEPSQSPITVIQWGITPGEARVVRTDGTAGLLDLNSHPKLKTATPTQRSNWIYDPEKHSVRWPDLNYELLF